MYQWYEGAWTNAGVTGNYYLEKAIPRSLVTTITNIVGNTLTLADAATVAATNMNVYFDNWPVLGPLIENGSGGSVPTDNTISLNAGEFAFSDVIDVMDHDDIVIAGQGDDATTLFSPMGVPSFMIRVALNPRTIIANLHVKGNAKNIGYGLRYTDGYAPPATGGAYVTEVNLPQGTTYPSGILFDGGSHDGRALNVKITDVFQSAVGTRFANNVWAYNCDCIVTDPLRVYLGWMMQWADSDGGGLINCSIDSNYLTAGFESFKSTNTIFVNCTGRNVSASANDAGNFLYDNMTLVVEGMSIYDQTSFSHFNPLVNVNTNIGGLNAPLGGTIRNPRILQPEFVDETATNVLQAIVVNADNPDITITGPYPDDAVDDPNGGGYIEFPDCNVNGAKGVNSTGLNTVVQGIRVKGINSHVTGSIKLTQAGVVEDCVADGITGGTQTNNQDNATWEASH